MKESKDQKKSLTHLEKKIDIYEEYEEDIKELTLSLEDKIEAFNLLTWASLAAIFVSIWQIIIPFQMFSLNFSQFCLGVTSIFFFLVSLVVLYWSHKNYKYLQDHSKEEHILLPTAHIEGMIYIISFLLIACYVTFLVGIILEASYSSSLLIAQGVGPAEAYKQAIVIVIAQSVLILGDLVILTAYVKYCYHLEFLPKHLPKILGLFLMAFIVALSCIIGDQEYLKSYIGRSHSDVVKSTEQIHDKIFWASIIFIFISFFFIYETRSTQMQLIPKVRFYFMPFFALFFFGFYVLFHGLEFLFNASNVNKSMKQDCKGTLQQFGQDFVQKIGCPYKYKTTMIENQHAFSTNCPTQNMGIVWEQDVGKPVDQQKNQLACLNLDCCYLVADKRSLNYKQFFLLIILNIQIGWIACGHSLNLAMQSPKKVKGGPKIYSIGMLAFQLIISIIALCTGAFFVLQYQPNPPLRLPNIQQDSIKLSINKHPKNYPHEIVIDSLDACSIIDTVTADPIKVEFNPKNCSSDTISNPKLCNKDVQGIAICLTGENGIFQLDPKWDAKKARIDSLNVFDPYLLQQTLHGKITNDKFCADGAVQDLNSILRKSLYFCVNPGKQAVIKSEQKQLLLDYLVDQQNEKDKQKRLLMRKKQVSQQEDHLAASNNDFNFVNTDKYGRIELNIFDAETAASISGGTVVMIQDATQCSLLDDAVFYPIRQVTTNSQGVAAIENILVVQNKKLLLQVRADGYLYNCFNIDQLKPNDNIKIQMPLVRSFSEQQSMKILIFYQDASLDLELGGSYNLNDQNSCRVGYYNEKCGGLFYKVSYSNKLLRIQKPAQVINMHEMVNQKYLFFMKIIPQDQTLRDVINNNLILTDNQKQQVIQLNNQFIQSGVTMNVYVFGRQYPVNVLRVPKENYQQENDYPIVWLSLCVDGSIGQVSQSPLKHFWESASGKFWNKNENDPAFIPNANICSQYYSENNGANN